MFWVNNLRVIAIFAVVLLHVAAPFVVSNIHGSYDWWAGNIYDSITRWSVPVFVMISGYLLLNKDEDNIVFFKKRFNRVIKPLLFWSLLFSLWVLLKGEMKGLDSKELIISIIKDFLLGKPYYHLWFIFMIPFLYIITPYLKKIINNSSKKEFLFLMLFCFVLSMLNQVFDFFGNHSLVLFSNGFLPFIGYYLLGGYIGKYKPEANVLICLTVLIASILITISGSYYLSYDYFYSYLSFNTVIASIAAFFIIMKCFKFDIKLKELSDCSFGIYLIHPIVIDFFSLALKHKLLNVMNIYLFIPLTACIVFFISYLLIKTMRKMTFVTKHSLT
ncbi:hypothetical protein C9I87_15985 [Photobacterium iliopiscarium]|jgi:surface polysaccharide O-acyltransferase-like enzyme|uniref:acyltransferase n=1 Tax=Photobacterium iliopiscarium TaxID=56192 RepID=UPI000D155927|nr:acyltransferase family protein [Photobacterium iliopiscarium]PST90011.1 hypothetical protein C9I87_15985 [Photobacterium iliopiscarium]